MDNKEKRTAECECGRVLCSKGMEEKGTTKEINEMIGQWEKKNKYYRSCNFNGSSTIKIFQVANVKERLFESLTVS